jgi:hypothetical protein
MRSAKHKGLSASADDEALPFVTTSDTIRWPLMMPEAGESYESLLQTNFERKFKLDGFTAVVVIPRRFEVGVTQVGRLHWTKRQTPHG